MPRYLLLRTANMVYIFHLLGIGIYLYEWQFIVSSGGFEINEGLMSENKISVLKPLP